MQRYVNISSREIDGVLLLDKPTGISSSILSNKIKKLFCASKAGHAGTLDPLATGMLPICLGRATKFAKYLLNSDKRYRVFAKLGESTDTFDSDGTVISVSSVQVNNKKLEQCLEHFRGTQSQIPPMFSSLKYRGLPLYKYARKGINVLRKPRTINVYSLDFLGSIYQQNIIKLDVHCSKGTYIRSIVNDLGICLGCGAHVIALRRLSIGQYESISMISLSMLEAIFFNHSLSDHEVLHKLDTLLIPMHQLNKIVFMT